MGPTLLNTLKFDVHLLNIFLFCRFLALSTGIIYSYYAVILKVDEEEFGGHGALLQEGLFASITLFLVLCYVVRCFICCRKWGFYCTTVWLQFNICAAFLDSSLQFRTLLIGWALKLQQNWKIYLITFAQIAVIWFTSM